MTKKQTQEERIDSLEWDLIHLDNIIASLRNENTYLWELLKLYREQNDRLL
jgi:hypothetical protein